MVISAVMAALALTLPVAFHAVGLGSKFLPMLLPLLLNGFLAPWPWAVLTGATAPWVSALVTGMPPVYPPVALIMSCEGAVLAGVAGAVYRRGRGWLWPALVLAILCGRATAFSSTWVLARSLDFPAAFASSATLVQGLPGVALQLAVVPLAVRGLSRRKGLLFAHEHDPEATLLQ